MIVPNYYQNFKCIAGRCKHNCCIGWEIDIDEDTLDYYDTVDGDLGKRMKEQISLEGTPHFILGEQERCPFLNRDNLCDIITGLGEEGLCQICNDHPRFYNEWESHTELGLGLCCEAAGALILGQKEKTVFTPFSSRDPFFALRERVFAVLQDRNIPIGKRLEAMLTLCGSSFTAIPQDWVGFYKELERLDPVWEDKLEQITASPLPAGWEIPFEQLAVYFAYRHLRPEQLKKRAAFVALSVTVIAAIFAKEEQALESLVEIARLYSSEIEYSDENVEKILEHIT